MKKNNFQRIMRVIYLIAAVLSFITVVNFSFYLTDRSLSVCTLSKTNVTAVKIKKSDKHQGDENALAHIKLINKNLQIE
ncbi:MAG: hypothetical protein ISR55_06980, partial [Bacteroidetes bacterium]|nr:hypothetical protein [Bacteroidota bacterium]